MTNVTQILSKIRDGDHQASSELLPLVYAELRRLAARKMKSERMDHTLQPTALVHEVWLRLFDRTGPDQFENKRHFYSAAAESMRRILVESARRRQSLKRGGDLKRQALTDGMTACVMRADDLVALDEALGRLAAEDATKAELVKLRFFAGLSHQEAAQTLGISRATADRYWSYAKVWLYVEIKADLALTDDIGENRPKTEPG